MKSAISLRALFSLAILFYSYLSKAQTPINVDQAKFYVTEYIFLGQPLLFKCDVHGVPVDTAADKAMNKFRIDKTLVFIIVDSFTNANGDDHSRYYVIRFNDFKLKKGLFTSKTSYDRRKASIIKYNLKGTYDQYTKDSSGHTLALSEIKKESLATYMEDESNRAYFAIKEDDLKKYAYLYEPLTRYEFAVGTVNQLARIRPRVDTTKGFWGSDLNLGLSAGIKYNLTKNAGLTFLGGIAISKVVIDSISTRGFLTSNRSGVALTPSINLLFGYKNFSMGAALAVDFVNEDSQDVKHWIYNRRGYFGIAFGINIFTTSPDGTTPKADAQTTKN